MRYVLCDDDKIHNEFLAEMLTTIIDQHKLDAELVLATNTSEDILKYAKENCGDTVYFLDLELEGDRHNGLAIAKAIRTHDPFSYIVYVSAHLEYAMDCFRTKASDFLVKPFRYEQLQQCLLGIIRDHRLAANDLSLSVIIGSATYIIMQRDILYFEKQREYVVAHTLANTYRWRESYLTLLERISLGFFMQTHKGYIVNRQYIAKYNRREQTICLSNGTCLPVSRGFQPSIEACLAEEGVTDAQ